MRRAKGAILLAVAGAALGAWLLYGGARRAPRPVTVAVSAQPAPPPPAASASAEPETGYDSSQCASRPLRLPTGAPAQLSCEAARRVVQQVRDKIASPVPTPAAQAFADATTGWLDPHGLWSAAPDAPTRAALRRLAPALLRELETPVEGGGQCEVAHELARIELAWVNELRQELESARREARRATPERALAQANEGVFQDDPVTRPARELARELGQRIGVFEHAFGDAGQAASAAAARLTPDLGVETWTGVVLAAAVRAYVPAVDPHGQWAPLDEEWSLYTADPALDAEPRLWGRMVRTALGVRLDEDPAPPLVAGDLVLAVGGVATAGLSVEQIDQLSHLEAVAGETTRDVLVLRKGESKPRNVAVELAEASDGPAAELAQKRLSFGDGDALVVTIPDVPDDLGEELEQLVAGLADGPKPPLGILLDLRGNGGGSIDGASGAIGVFLPGAPSFPLRRRGGEIEIEHATTPAQSGQWQGPVAVLVDGFTASAAEMIAGALGAYRRGPVIGSHTFGKGCIQEYFDDRAGVGVLRLTTMLFALPDGSPLQGVGLSPSLLLPLPATPERERALGGSLQPWSGPDVRSREVASGPDWPNPGGRLGPCSDPVVCTALRRVGSASALRRSASNVVGRSTRRAGQ